MQIGVADSAGLSMREAQGRQQIKKQIVLVKNVKKSVKLQQHFSRFQLQRRKVVYNFGIVNRFCNFVLN